MLCIYQVTHTQPFDQRLFVDLIEEYPTNSFKIGVLLFKSNINISLL
jgi:hypothetical protein